MQSMNGSTKHILQSVFPLCAGVGLGMLFHAPYQVFLRSLKQSELASGTSAFFLVRFTGATVGLVRSVIIIVCLQTLTPSQAVAGAAFNGHLARSLPSSVGPASLDLKHLNHIYPLELQTQVLHAVSSSIRVSPSSLSGGVLANNFPFGRPYGRYVGPA